jgi:hypothetical protein
MSEGNLSFGTTQHGLSRKPVFAQRITLLQALPRLFD